MDFTPELIAAFCTGLIGVLAAAVPLIRALRAPASTVKDEP